MKAHGDKVNIIKVNFRPPANNPQKKKQVDERDRPFKPRLSKEEFTTWLINLMLDREKADQVPVAYQVPRTTDPDTDFWVIGTLSDLVFKGFFGFLESKIKIVFDDYKELGPLSLKDIYIKAQTPGEHETAAKQLLWRIRQIKLTVGQYERPLTDEEMLHERRRLDKETEVDKRFGTKRPKMR
jgi:hypothetical protein